MPNVRPGRYKLMLAVLATASVALAACSSSSKNPGTSGESSSTKSTTTSSTLFSMLPASIQSSKVVTLATEAEYPPCESMSSNNQTMIGYEPDLWNAMAAKLGVKIDASSIAFDSLIPGVQSGRYDMAMECISDNTAREQQVTFVDNAYATGAVYTLASNTSITTNPLSLCGLTTATQQGLDLAQQIESTFDPYCTQHGKAKINLQQFPSETAALLALYSGRVNFVLNDYAAAAALQAAAPKPLRYVTDPLLQKYYNGMVFNLKSVQLQKAFLAALKAIIADGTYQAIMTKWKLPGLELTSPGINLAASKPLPTPSA
jgi:polar amino acid transport system substrate-binding protein